MSGWQIAGICLLATPFVVGLIAGAVYDLGATVFAVSVTVIVGGIIIVGAMLATGDWQP